MAGTPILGIWLLGFTLNIHYPAQPDPANETMIRCERALRGLVNADAESYRHLERQYRQLQLAFQELGYAGVAMSRREFTSRNDFLGYRRLCQALKKTERQMIVSGKRAVDTERRIEHLLDHNPRLCRMLAELKYTDRAGRVSNLTVFVRTGSLSGDFRIAQTQFQISTQNELYYPHEQGYARAHAVLITLDKRRWQRDALPHEAGHVLALAASPREYSQQLRERPCDFDCQFNPGHPVAREALLWQEMKKR